MEYDIRVNEAWVQCVHQAVTKYLDTWPGGDPMEQEDLITMRDNFYKIMLEHQFENM